MKSWLKGLYYELNVNSLMKNEKYEISQIFIALKKIFPCLKQWSIQICELTIWLKNWFITLTRVQHFWNWALIEFFEFRENWVHVESGREVLGCCLLVQKNCQVPFSPQTNVVAWANNRLGRTFDLSRLFPGKREKRFCIFTRALILRSANKTAKKSRAAAMALRSAVKITWIYLHFWAIFRGHEILEN